jgi:hypothetical protein
MKLIGLYVIFGVGDLFCTWNKIGNDDFPRRWHASPLIRQTSCPPDAPPKATAVRRSSGVRNKYLAHGVE